MVVIVVIVRAGGRVGFVLLNDGNLVLASEPAAQVDQLAALGAEGEGAAGLAGLRLVDGGFADRAAHAERSRLFRRLRFLLGRGFRLGLGFGLGRRRGRRVGRRGGLGGLAVLGFAAGLRIAAAGGRVGLGGLVVRVAAVVRDVKAAALEEQARAGADQAAHLRLATLRALLDRRGGDRLELLERVAAGLALVLVSRHGNRWAVVT